MFTFRIIEETRENENEPFDQVISNHELGNAYSIFKKGSTSEFYKKMKDHFPEENKNEVEAIVVGENKIMFFVERKTDLKNNSYYIMSENGATYEKL